MAQPYTNLSQAYDALMYDVDYGQWADYIIKLLRFGGIKKGVHVLDAACGTGNITLKLYTAGYNVIASDLSETMLNIASDKFKKIRADIPVINQDIREIALHKKADAVICACDGVNYLQTDEDVLLFFKSAYDNLNAGGMLLFDISSEYKLKEVIANGVFCDETEDMAYIWKNSFKDGFSYMDLTLFVKQGEMFKRYTEQHVQKAHNIETLQNLLYNAGFMDINSYGFLTKKAPAKTAERIQFTAKK